MTRAQRALACAVGIIPTTITGIALVRCGCSTAAFALELATAAAYVVWILLRGKGAGVPDRGDRFTPHDPAIRSWPLLLLRAAYVQAVRPSRRVLRLGAHARSRHSRFYSRQEEIRQVVRKTEETPSA